MAKTLPASVVLEKNKLSTTNTWVILLDVTLPDSTMLYITNNNEDVVFNGQTYTAIPFTLDDVKENSKGELPTISLKISNITRSVQALMEDPDIEGMVGGTVRLQLVNTLDLTGTTDFSELDLTFTIMSSSSDAYWATFNLGAGSPLNKRFPLDRYIASHCRFTFNNLTGKEGLSPECGYVGVDTSCERTLSACQAKSNSERFGGYVGLDKGGVRVV